MNETPKPPRGRPRKLDVDKTLEVAMRAYWRDDPADVSLNAVCALAEVSKPALYRVFGGEDGLSRAVLERYAHAVLSDLFVLLTSDTPMTDAMAALIHFGSEDPKMETGCVFFKMRAGKHRLGPDTRALVDEIEENAVQAFADYLEKRRAAGDWTGAQPPSVAGRYLFEQVGLALAQRAAGEDTAHIKATLTLAISAVHPM